MELKGRLQSILLRIARAAERAHRSTSDVTLIAVTKTIAPPDIEQAFRLGVRHFGENRVQAAQRKLAELADLRPHMTWHMVGNLQSNKAKISTEVFDIIQSVASVDLGERLDGLLERPMPVCLEVNVAEEATKHGFRPAEVAGAWKRLRRCRNLDVRGLMTIAPLAADPEQARPVFRRLRELASDLGLAGLSMGMTNDFDVAIEEGATMVRIGRAIFGP